MIENSINCPVKTKFTWSIALPTRKLYIFCQESPNFGKGTTVKFKKNGQKQGTILLCKLGRWISIRNTVLYPWYQIFALCWFYASANFKPDPSGDPRDCHRSSCPWSLIFAPLSFPGSVPGVLNQRKSSIISIKARFLLCLLNKWLGSRSSFHNLFLYMLELSSVTQGPFTL